jgi:hypothetical protein
MEEELCNYTLSKLSSISRVQNEPLDITNKAKAVLLHAMKALGGEEV